MSAAYLGIAFFLSRLGTPYRCMTKIPGPNRQSSVDHIGFEPDYRILMPLNSAIPPEDAGIPSVVEHDAGSEPVPLASLSIVRIQGLVT